MPAKKKATSKSTDNPIKVLIDSDCPTSSGKSTLGYQVGADDKGGTNIRIASNSGGGFYSDEWVAFTDIQRALDNWPGDSPMTSFALKDLHRGRSSNNGGFTIAILNDLGIVQPITDRKRCFELADVKGFLAQVKALQGDGGTAAKKKSTAKAKPKASAKAKPAPKAKAKSPRKSPATKRKAK